MVDAAGYFLSAWDSSVALVPISEVLGGPPAPRASLYPRRAVNTRLWQSLATVAPPASTGRIACRGWTTSRARRAAGL